MTRTPDTPSLSNLLLSRAFPDEPNNRLHPAIQEYTHIISRGIRRDSPPSTQQAVVRINAHRDHEYDICHLKAVIQSLRQLAWTFPTRDIIDTFNRLPAGAPVIDAGAGTGVLSLLLSARHPVHAIDCSSNSLRFVHDDILAVLPPNSHNIRTTFADAADTICGITGPGSILLLSWPPLHSPMAHRCLEAFTGATVALVAEHSNGCCATPEFFADLDRQFRTLHRTPIPKLHHASCALSIHGRSETTS